MTFRHSGFQSIRTIISVIKNLRASSDPVRMGLAALLQAVKHNEPIISRATIPIMNSVVLGEKVSFEILKFIERILKN